MQERTIILHSNSTKDTQKLGVELADKIIQTNMGGHNPQIILLSGDLGSGKTAFAQGFSSYFGIKRMLSPTFNIMTSYNIRSNTNYTHLIHADLYRIKDIQELAHIDFFNILSQKGNISLIEWPNMIEQHITKLHKDIKLTQINFNYGERANQRIISYN